MTNNDLEIIEHIHQLMRAEKGEDKPFFTHRRELYESILERAIKNDTTYVKVPCPGACCKNRVDIYRDDLQRIIDHWEDNPSPSDLFCDHCSMSGGVGRPFTRWREACPKVFLDGTHETDPSRFPQYAWEQIKNWGETMRDNTNSLYVFGQTGTCKSRMMYLALFEFVVLRMLSFQVFRGGELYDLFCDNFSSRFEKKENYESVRDKLTSYDVLVFDDFGQDQLTEVMFQSLWGILDDRFSEGKRTVFLSNFSPQRLKPRYGNAFSTDSLVRRIEEFCTIVPTGGEAK